VHPQNSVATIPQNSITTQPQNSLAGNLNNNTLGATDTQQTPPSAVSEPRNRSFRAAITPAVDLKTPFSPTQTGGVSFTMRRRNGVMNLQWEPFSATIPVRGNSALNVRQSIGDLPPYPVHVPYQFRLNGIGKIGFVRIDPLDSSANIKFVLSADDRDIAEMNSTFETSGGQISWIISH
jgi:hypothetical protein